MENSRHKLRENKFLDGFETRIATKERACTDLSRERAFLGYAIPWGLRVDCFGTGNGEKILKRCLNYSRRLGSPIQPTDIARMFIDFPGSRETILRWSAASDDPNAYFKMLIALFSSGETIDDLAVLQIANAMVSARLPRNDETYNILTSIDSSLTSMKPWHFYAKLWIYSKYATPKNIMDLIGSSVSVWATQEVLSRLAAGMFPRIIGSQFEAKFDNTIRRAASRWAQDVLDFHHRLVNTSEGLRSVLKFVAAQNPSQPNRMTHAKFLMLLSMLHNRNVAPAATSRLRTRHAFALTDDFYAGIAESASRSTWL